TIEQQVALDEALVPSTKRLRIGKSNYRLPSDIQSKESTLQVIYDVLRSCPFFKAFLVTADVPEIYMQEFWVTVYVHQHSIRFKLDNKKHIVDLETFRNMLHICPRIPGQSFDELPFEAEILKFLRFLRDSAQIRTLTDVNINKLFQPSRSFGAVINKCLTGKCSGFDSFRLSQAQILWGLYHSRNIDYAFLILEDFVYQDLSIPRRNKVNWHYVRDDNIFSIVKVVSRHQNTQQYGAILPIELMNEDIRNTKAYKEYYAYASGEASPKPKASARRKRGGFDSSTTPPTDVASPRPTTGAVTPRLTAAAKGKQPAKAKNDDDDDDNEEEIAKIDEQDDTERGGDEKKSENDEESDDEETREEESFDPIPRTPKDSEDNGNGEEDQDLRISEEERIHEEEADELYRDVNINQGRGLQVSHDIEDSHVTLTPVHPDGQQESSLVSSFVTSMLNPISDAGVDSIFMTASSSVAPLPTPIPTMTPSIITTITTSSHPPIPPTPILSEFLQNLPTFDSVFRFNERLKSLEASFSEYRQTNPFAEAVSNIPVAVDLSEMKLKKILIEKMEENKSIQRLDEQRNLYKALVDAYEADKTILDSYGETAILKRRREDDDDQEGPSIGSNHGSKRRREGGEPESARASLEPITRSAGRSITGFKSRQVSASESALAEEPVQTISQIEEPSHPVFETAVQGSAQTWISELAKQDDSRSSFNELLDTPIDFSNFIMNRLGVDTLTPGLLAGPTYELMRGLCNSLTELEYHLEEVYKATTDQLDWVNPEGQQYPHNLLQPLPLIPDNRGRRVIPFAHFINNDLEYLRISVRRDDDKIYKFKEGDFKRLRLQDIEDMLLLLVQRKLSNLTVEERFAFNVSVRMFTRSIVIQRRVEDLQLGVESYQKRLNLTKPDTYQSDLKRRKADGTLNDVRNALDDRLKGIRMQYLPQTIWRKGDKDRAAAMIQAIDKMLKTRRMMRSLERFIRGRLYEGDFRMLQRTI
nr:hypothetical protein [Tanacetum cinerariifolium]